MFSFFCNLARISSSEIPNSYPDLNNSFCFSFCYPLTPRLFKHGTHISISFPGNFIIIYFTVCRARSSHNHCLFHSMLSGVVYRPISCFLKLSIPIQQNTEQIKQIPVVDIMQLLSSSLLFYTLPHCPHIASDKLHNHTPLPAWASHNEYAPVLPFPV